MPLVAAAIPAAIGVAGSVISANSQRSAARDAARAQQQASDAQIALQREQLAYARQAAQPYIAGGDAANKFLDARWNVSPQMASANRAYAGGPSAPDPYAAYGAPRVYGANASAPVTSAYGSAPQTRAPTRQAAPSAPQAEAPWWQSVNFQLPQGYSYTPPPPPAPTTNQRAPNPNVGGPRFRGQLASNAYDAYGQEIAPGTGEWFSRMQRRQLA